MRRNASCQPDHGPIRINAERNRLTFSIPSEHRFVYHVLLEVEELFETQRVEGAFELTIVLRELLVNAVEHGNQRDAGLKVTGSVERLEGPRYRIAVEDEGAGFDHRGLDMALPEDPKHVQDRGYTLINALTDQLEFSEKGNRITAVLTLKNGEDGYMKDNSPMGMNPATKEVDT